MVERKHIWERLAISADLSAESVPKQPIIELAGDRRVIIENHHGVIGYGNTEICVKARYGHIVICGKFLHLVRMTKDQLVIMGEIDSVRLCRGGK